MTSNVWKVLKEVPLTRQAGAIHIAYAGQTNGQTCGTPPLLVKPVGVAGFPECWLRSPYASTAMTMHHIHNNEDEWVENLRNNNMDLMFDYDTLNPGIHKLVKLLHENHFATTDSGDGKTHEYECDRPYGYVVVKCRPNSIAHTTDELAALLKANGISLGTYESLDGLPTGTVITATYSPGDEYAYIDVSYIYDTMLTE